MDAETRNRYRLRFAKLSEVLSLQRAFARFGQDDGLVALLASVRMTEFVALIVSIRMTTFVALVALRSEG